MARQDEREEKSASRAQVALQETQTLQAMFTLVKENADGENRTFSKQTFIKDKDKR